MSERQKRYEAFLNKVQEREEAKIRQHLPKALEQMVGFINEAKEVLKDHPNWPKQREKFAELYKVARDASLDSDKRLAALKEMVHYLNSWWKRLSWRVELKYKFVNDSYKYDPKASRIDELWVQKEASND